MKTASTDLTTTVGSVTLPNPVMTASGTAGHGTELAAFQDLSRLGAVVVKSLAAGPWAGNPPPRVREAPAGMVNSIGLQGPGVPAWLAQDLPALQACGARVVASIWGRTVDEYAAAAALLADAPDDVVAVEVNLSCPNLDGGSHLFAHDPALAAAAIAATAACGRPRWAKLSPNTADLVDVAGAVAEAGAEAVTLINTVQATLPDDERHGPRFGGGGGGLSGPAIHPVAVRAVYAVRAAHPDLPIVGVGGVTDAETALDLVTAGASAVQVGTATFAHPGAPSRVLDQLETWCRRSRTPAVRELIGTLHV
ncbi:MAG TPA: dihydroorotate dehydrogenase [Acidimicrobiales bacterium]|nr:dihydroorotate dehydrogenase [Acidimicrobiales bacterium]